MNRREFIGATIAGAVAGPAMQPQQLCGRPLVIDRTLHADGDWYLVSFSMVAKPTEQAASFLLGLSSADEPDEA